MKQKVVIANTFDDFKRINEDHPYGWGNYSVIDQAYICGFKVKFVDDIIYWCDDDGTTVTPEEVTETIDEYINGSHLCYETLNDMSIIKAIQHLENDKVIKLMAIRRIEIVNHTASNKKGKDIVIYLDKPGLLIGKGGRFIDAISAYLEYKYDTEVWINIKETKTY